jgi:hypothetical protein
MDDSLKLAFGVILALAGGLVFLVKKRNGPNKSQKSGDMDPAFWQLEQRKVLTEILTPVLDRQQLTFEALLQTNRDIHLALGAIRQLVENRQ